MGTSVSIPRFIYGTEAQILALTPADDLWKDLAFYYCSDKAYFYQVAEGIMKKYGDANTAGVGITLNGVVMGVVKTLISEDDILNIPENYDYNTLSLNVEGVINCTGQINIL